MSIDTNAVGAASPVEAAARFVTADWVRGFSDLPPDGPWTVSGTDVPGRATITAPGVRLQAMQAPNGTWFIDTAERCP